MQLKYLYASILLIAIVAMGCSKDFLNRVPETNISDGEFWKTANDLRLYSNSFYNAFPEERGFSGIGIYGWDASQGSDNMIQMDPNTRLNGDITPSGAEGWASTDWSALRNVNYLLANYAKVSDSWDNVKQYVGEALFFRAWFYFDKLRKFGDLPWINEPLDLNSAELFTPRASRSIIADSILADLDRAADYLPAKGSAGAGRLYKEVALAMASRVSLYEGTWEKYHAGTVFGVAGSNGQKYLQKCVMVSESVMSNTAIGLDNTSGSYGYWNLFNKTDYSASKEIMFCRQYNAALGIAHNWHRYSIGGAAKGITKDLIDDYLCTDGKPISVSPLYQGDNTLLSVVTNRDPRLRQSLYVPDGEHIITNNRANGAAPLLFETPTFAASPTEASATGYQVYKGHQPDNNQQSAAEKGTTALILFRFAEVLLNYAEAKAELGQLSQIDVDKTINLLRRRVGMPDLVIASITPDSKWIFPQLSPLINEVRRERRVELACEGFRHDDIFRWAAAGILIKGWKPKGAKRAQWDGIVAATVLNAYPVDANGYIEKFQNSSAVGATGYKFNTQRDYLWPIPLAQLQVPNNTLTQNPGWGQ